MIRTFILVVALGLAAAVWEYHRVRQHLLKTRDMELECAKKEREIRKLEIEIDQLRAKNDRIVVVNRGKNVLQEKIIRLRELGNSPELLVRALGGRLIAPDYFTLEDDARKMDKTSAQYKQRLVELLALDAFLIGLGSENELAKVGIIQLRNLYENCFSDALMYLHLILQAKAGGPESLILFLEQEIELAIEAKKSREVGQVDPSR